MNVSQKEQRRSSIIRQSPPEQPTRIRHNDDALFPSIAPSQSASQVMLKHDHEEEPLLEPVGIHSPVNAAEPVSPSIATTTTVAAAPPAPEPEPELTVESVESNTAHPRPPSSNSTTTITGSSICHSLAMPALGLGKKPLGGVNYR